MSGAEERKLTGGAFVRDVEGAVDVLLRGDDAAEYGFPPDTLEKIREAAAEGIVTALEASCGIVEGKERRLLLCKVIFKLMADFISAYTLFDCGENSYDA